MSDNSGSRSSRSNNAQSCGPQGLKTANENQRLTVAADGHADLPMIDLETQRALRRRIFQDLPRINRSFDPNRIELEVPPEFLSSQTAADKGKGSRVPQHETSDDPSPNAVNENVDESPLLSGGISDLCLARSSPIKVLGAGRIDPFATYPIEMNKWELWLIDQVNTGEDPTFRSFRERWLPVAIQDAATFHQFLANVSLNVSHVRGEDLDTVATAHHFLAIRSVNQKLSDPELCISDNVVASILCFICYGTVKEDFHSVSIHLDGLNKVIRLRGGYESVGRNPALMNLAFGMDITRSLRQDTKPQFPLPEAFLQSAQNDQSTDDFVFFGQAPRSGPWRQIFPPNHTMISVFDDLHNSVEAARLKSARNQQWRVISFVIFRMYPIVHRLLSIEFDSNDRWSIMQEASRLGIMLFLGEIRRQCGALGVSTRLYVTKLKIFMEGFATTINWTEANALLLWILFFGLLESWQLPEQDWYVESMIVVMEKMSLKSWDEVVEKVKGWLWVDDVYHERVELFRVLVSSQLRPIEVIF